MGQAGHDHEPPHWLRWLTRASVALGLVALIATVAIVGVGTIVDRLRAIGGWFAVLFAIEAVAAGCDGLAIYLMTRGAGAPDMREVLVAQFAGRAVNMVTPAANLGEVLKVSLLARRCSTPRVIAAVMYVALAGLVIALALVAIGIALTAISFEVPVEVGIPLGVAAASAALLATTIVLLVNRGLLTTLANVAARLHLVSRPRRARWAASLDELDARLRGDVSGEHRKGAAALVIASQLIQKLVTWATIVAAGYHLSPAQIIAVLSAGVVIGWISTLVPLGLGVAEGGNAALFSIIGAPLSLGVALALARRVNQIVFAIIGFGVLAADRVAGRVAIRIVRRPTPVHAQ